MGFKKIHCIGGLWKFFKLMGNLFKICINCSFVTCQQSYAQKNDFLWLSI